MEENKNRVSVVEHAVDQLLPEGKIKDALDVYMYMQRAIHAKGDILILPIKREKELSEYARKLLSMRMQISGQKMYCYNVISNRFTDLNDTELDITSLNILTQSITGYPYIPTNGTRDNLELVANHLGIAKTKQFGLKEETAAYVGDKMKFHELIVHYDKENSDSLNFSIPHTICFEGSHINSGGGEALKQMILLRKEAIDYARQKNGDVGDFPLGIAIRDTSGNGGVGLYFIEFDYEKQTFTISANTENGPIFEELGQNMEELHKFTHLFANDHVYNVGGLVDKVEDIGISAYVNNGELTIIRPNGQIQLRNGGGSNDNAPTSGTHTLRGSEYEYLNGLMDQVKPLFAYLLQLNGDNSDKELMFNIDFMRVTERQLMLARLVNQDERYRGLFGDGVSEVMAVECNPRLTNFTAIIIELAVILGKSIETVIGLINDCSLQISTRDKIYVPDSKYNNLDKLFEEFKYRKANSELADKLILFAAKMVSGMNLEDPKFVLGATLVTLDTEEDIFETETGLYGNSNGWSIEPAIYA